MEIITYRPDFPLIVGRIPLNLASIAAMENGRACVETVNTKILLEVTALPNWVLIQPLRDLCDTTIPEIFVHAYVLPENVLSLAVYSKHPDGHYFDEDFRAMPLACAAAEFLLSVNPEVQRMAFEYNRGSDTYKAYMDSKKIHVGQGLPEDVARIMAVSNVRGYASLACPLGFTLIEAVEEEKDPSTRQMKVVGTFSREGVGISSRNHRLDEA